MGSYLSHKCFNLWYQLIGIEVPSSNLTQELPELLNHYCNLVRDLELEHNFSKPMPWIGIYIAVASLFCILAMAADLLHGFRSRKLWFPSKYFKLNAASITVVAVAMKLPVDLNNPMPGTVDHVAKLGSMAFMCTMMANLLPSLATMDNKELITNGIALGILVITVVVNFCIQIKTGLLIDSARASRYFLTYSPKIFYIYAVMIVFLLAVLTSLALIVPTSKRILETKFQAAHKTASNYQHPQILAMSMVEKLRQHVRNYWVMAETGSPQFVMASSPICSASGVICVSSAAIHTITVVNIFVYHGFSDYQSEYGWSMVIILMTQFVGIILGTIAPVLRCFSALCFELSMEWGRNQINIFRVESYYTQMLSDWRKGRINFHTGGRKCKIFVHNVKSLVISICIWLEKIIVVACKIIGLIATFVVMSVLYCWKLLKAMFRAAPIASKNEHEQQHNTRNDLGNYVLQLQDGNVLAERTLKFTSNSANCMIRKAEKQRPRNLLKLLEKSTGFEGVKNFDSDQVSPLLSEEPFNCWSLPIVTLTSIAITLPNVQNDAVDCLLSGVSEGIFYTSLVEESHNGSDELVSIQRAAKRLWVEVEVHCKWLENNLRRNAHKGKTSKEILEWFNDKAEETVVELQKSTNGQEENTLDKSIAANSMYRIVQTIQLNYRGRIEQYSEEQLFLHLSGTIADILAACLTNLPQVITTKCYASAIDKLEESVEAAAQLLGQSKDLINKLQERELPCLDPEQMAFIEEWRAFQNHQFL